MIIASFYTLDTPYEQEAHHLIASLDRLGLSHSVLGCPNLRSWDLNTKWKPHVILQALNLFDQPVLFVDADATFDAAPGPMPDCDLAAHVMDKAFWRQDTSRRSYSLMSGTLFVGNTDAARQLMLDWQAENDLEPKRWDQHNLEAVVGFNPQTGQTDGRIRFASLPMQYCAIDRTMPHVPGAIIRHHQASRRLKARIV